MLFFLDTSALLKRYRQEPGSETVERLFRDPTNLLLASALSFAEAVGALTRSHRVGLIGQRELEEAVSGLYTDFAAGRLEWIDISHHHLMRCAALIVDYQLTANDALILTAALELQRHVPVFVCADVRSGLLRAAESHGLSTLNPLSPTP
jgi:predicted nucleic acid-binding protein